MNSARNKHAWLWVAIAALSLASVSRGEAGLDSARASSNPVLQFLARSHNGSATAKLGAARYAQRSAARSLSSVFRSARAEAWTAFLPVCFVGLVAVSVHASGTARIVQPQPSPVEHPALFQRPPPQRA